MEDNSKEVRKIEKPDHSGSIRIAGNTMIPTLQAIDAKCYKISVWFIQDRDDGLVPQYDAERDSRIFSATSPEELLGLIAMWEVRGDDWNLKEGESQLWDKLLKDAQLVGDQGSAIDL